MENMIWALIIVTTGASVNVSTGYPNKSLCEDAISIAKTGMTVMEKKSADEADRVREARLDQEFLADNPTRSATEEDRKRCGHYSTKTGSSYTWYVGDSNCVIDNETNTVSFHRKSLLTFSYDGSGSNDIKYAKCVLIESATSPAVIVPSIELR